MSNKYENCDMIKAVAEDKSLVVFTKHNNHDSWCVLKNHGFPDLTGTHKYFLCLPQHKEACLHWLNGGEVQQSPVDENFWVTSADVNKVTWMPWTSFMKEDLTFRIKPKKEKRWIAFNTKALMTTRDTYTSGVECEDALNKVGEIYENHPWQFIEIEVEV